MPDPQPNPAAAPEIEPTADPALRAIAMPADTNPHGDIFGGWLLCQMDLAGSTVATRRAGGRVVTIAITAMTFHRPVLGRRRGFLLLRSREDRPYLDHHQDRELGAARRRLNRNQGHRGVFTYVRVDADGRPLAIAP